MDPLIALLAANEALMEFGLGAYTDALMDVLDENVEWDAEEDQCAPRSTARSPS